MRSLADGASFKAAAAAADVSERTLRRWRADPAFAAALKLADSEQVGEIARALNAAGQKAVAALVGILESPSTAPALRLRAAGEILRYRAAFYEIHNLTDRLDAIEARLEKRNGNNNG